MANGLARVVLDYLVFGHEAPSLTEVGAALDALASVGSFMDSERVAFEWPSPQEYIEQRCTRT